MNFFDFLIAAVNHARAPSRLGVREYGLVREAARLALEEEIFDGLSVVAYWVTKELNSMKALVEWKEPASADEIQRRFEGSVMRHLAKAVYSRRSVWTSGRGDFVEGKVLHLSMGWIKSVLWRRIDRYKVKSNSVWRMWDVEDAYFLVTKSSVSFHDSDDVPSWTLEASPIREIVPETVYLSAGTPSMAPSTRNTFQRMLERLSKEPSRDNASAICPGFGFRFLNGIPDESGLERFLSGRYAGRPIEKGGFMERRRGGEE